MAVISARVALNGTVDLVTRKDINRLIITLTQRRNKLMKLYVCVSSNEGKFNGVYVVGT